MADLSALISGASGSKQDLMKTMLSMIQENMSAMEDMEQQRILMVEAHEKEKERLRQQLEDEWQEECNHFREECQAKMQEITRDLNEYEKECREKADEEKHRMEQEMEVKRQRYDAEHREMERKMVEYGAQLDAKEMEFERKLRDRQMELDRVAAERAQIADEMENYRRQSERKLEQDRIEMERRQKDAQYEIEKMGKERSQLILDMETFREQCERNMREEKSQLQGEMTQMRGECERMKMEKDALMEATRKYREDCEGKMKDQTRQMEESRGDFQRQMEEERRKMNEEIDLRRKEIEAMTSEKESMAMEKDSMSKDMQDYRNACEQILNDQKEEMARRAAEHEQQRIQLEENMRKFRQEYEQSISKEKEEHNFRVQASMTECSRLAMENEQHAKAVSDHQGIIGRLEQDKLSVKNECERMAQEKADMLREMAEFRLDAEQKIAAVKAKNEREIAESRAEVERFVREKERMMSECDRMAMENERVARAVEEHRALVDRLESEKQASRHETERMAQEKLDMVEKMARFRQDYENQVDEIRRKNDRDITESRAEVERYSRERERMMNETSDFRKECERKIDDEKSQMKNQMEELRRQMHEERRQQETKMAQFREDTEKLDREKKQIARAVEESRAEINKLAEERAKSKRENERLAREKAHLVKEHDDFKQQVEKKLAEQKVEFGAQVAKSRTETARLAREVQQKEELNKQSAQAIEDFKSKESTMIQEKDRLIRKMNEMRAQSAQIQKEKEAMEHEKDIMEQKLGDLRMERERIEKEQAAQVKKLEEAEKKAKESERRHDDFQRQLMKETEDFRQECEKERQKVEAELSDSHRRVKMEQAANERRLAEMREQNDAQLQAEREITDHIRHALQELPPLQAAMELGDLRTLEDELEKWNLQISGSLARFGECKGVVEAVIKLARERLLTWRSVERTFKDVLRESEKTGTTLTALADMCHKLFRALKEAQLTSMDVRRSDSKAIDRMIEVVLAWQAQALHNSNHVQIGIVRKVIQWPNLGPFDFTDLEICLRLVDREEKGSEVFLSRAKALVEDKSVAPKNLRSLLAHVETMLFFLKYTKSEDLTLTYREFYRQRDRADPAVMGYLQWAEQNYPPGQELVRISNDNDLTSRMNVQKVLEDLRKPPANARFDGLGPFREIFYHWALTMKSKFDLLVLPHHTQVVCLMAFRCFMEQKHSSCHTLVAQVGTGEGKSMIIAALAIYVALVLRKKAHVVVDDETLLERDFFTYLPLFEAFTVPDRGGTRRKLTANLCVSEERLAAEGGKCAHLAARVDPDVDICYCEAKHVQSFYAGIARGDKRDFSGYEERVLILDEVDALIIDEEPNEAFVYPNKELSQMATMIARGLSQGMSHDALSRQFEANHPAAGRVVREMSKEWERGRSFTSGEDYVYSKEAGRYCLLQSGRANAKAWSLALECRNFQDGLCREILFQERLFVMSRPRVFRKYHKILGLSGSIGSSAERTFLKDTYRAQFFEVPPFLKTCRGSPFHEAVPVPLGASQQAVYVEPSYQAQCERLAEVALQAREKVPVLVIAKDRGIADELVDKLRQAARLRGLGGVAEDMVRGLSRNLLEADPEQWKDNLNRATLPLGGKSGGGGKSYRITVTDPRGGRGTDYRVDDPDVDSKGGLLLIPMLVPTSQRDWTQFLGRTARQDRRGQFCTVLNAADYTEMASKVNQELPKSGMKVVETILDWSDKAIARKIRASAALYNTGLRMNELCEEVFGRQQDLLDDSQSREFLVDVCQRMRWLSCAEVDQAFGRLRGFTPQKVPSEARDLGRPAEPPVASIPNAPGGAGGGPKVQGQKMVVFCLDWSASMLSTDTGTPLTRFGVCQKSVLRILRDQVNDQDIVSLVAFGSKVETVVPPIKKAEAARLDGKIQSLKPDWAGGTCFFDAVAQCLTMMGRAASQGPKWLVCLTDGDDLGSRPDNSNGQLVSNILRMPPAGLNMVMITVGRLKERNLQVIDSWVNQVSRVPGALGKHVSEKDASKISMAFEVVAECLAAEVGGAMVC
eukprot:TRINITY_DN37715_c0_g1_i1.p1 TRINITY_DN37715_c0_g1~~TRINITY_DN37715_c0_g1_i1.p1  ORF type:complete len:2022 (-),score=662.37 TRINITY_DN37715_c0_g1_i1:112-6177(-)